MITIYHNNRCSKSRECLAMLEENNDDLTIVNYLDTPPSAAKITELLSLLKISPIELIRKNEAIWKDSYKGKNLSDQEIIDAMAKHPKLIERPIVVKGSKAAIGRPIQKVIDIL